jgi:hypothetical protein
MSVSFPQGSGEPLLTLIVALVFCGFAFLRPLWLESVFRPIERAFSRFAKRTTMAICAIFFAVIAFRLAVLPFLPVPIPGIHDEFSYLLMADTFVHGRLANPPHPMWMSFETFHVNWFPTYSSIYPPAQGFVLALGQILGNPWIGVLLSCAAMCAAILWMLQAWMPPRWAFLGAVLAALKLGLASYWINSYWGGAVAAAGGALVLGALARIVRRARLRDALLLGLGVALLANSRPYEGFLFCIPAACWFLWWLAGRTHAHDMAAARLRKVLLPLSGVLLLTGIFMGYYNWRLTGHPLLMPHVLNTRTYDTTPLFLWQHPRPKLHYNNLQFEDFYNGWERENYDSISGDAWRVTAEKLVRSAAEFFWWGCLLLLPGLFATLRDRKMRFFVFTACSCLAGFFAVTWSHAHYIAPLTCIIFGLLVQSFRHLRTVRFAGRPVGSALSRAIVLLLVLDTGINVARGVCDPLHWPCEGDPSRVAIDERLAHTPGKHLIMVRYSKNHNIHDEWVYNGADIDGSKVLWARELSPQQNAKLFAYFKDRSIWLVEPDLDNTQLLPYTPPGN